ncbi:F-box protein At3g07870-like [Papaver somniferum]|uniref:F-box protein At3g07870-like n=1 Tax=Papaver somniferum TaxID=3469 RepID=UPI000E6F4EA7|nr:F-box protein At3g07870-like [Papaver somniferum]
MSLSSLPEDIGVDIFDKLSVNTIGINYASISTSSSKPIIRKESVVRKHFLFKDDKVVNNSYQIMGSSNGLICLGFSTKESEINICLWNPLTREYEVVRNPYCNGMYEFGNGFGYDPQNEDYKLVRIGFNEAEVHTLGTDSWKTIPHERYSYTCPRGKSENGASLLVNGVHHWLCVTGTREADHVIISFDMGNELLTEFPLPVQPWEHQHVRLGVWEDCLYLVFSSTTNHIFQIWVMQDYGVRDSWTKRFTLEVGENRELRAYPFRKPIWSFENGEFEIGMCRKFFLRDSQRERLRSLDIGGGVKLLYDQQSESYVESLVSLN